MRTMSNDREREKNTNSYWAGRESFIPVDVSRGVAFEHVIRLPPVLKKGINKIKFISFLPARNGRPFAYNIYTRRTIDLNAARRHRRRAGTAHNCGKSIVAKKPVCDTHFAGDENIKITPF